ncbi:class D sortase [Bacillus sp. REN16]|uniref:class D sortase n=1 Tax=Bacillus sp. REN16 TaxID=2887296 RepID=UPI001E335007|nr:class D sortase [Bacillus sp. REN16]MCC3356934.1 class D sortase [Bacillus sp. REN16]
MKRFVYTIALLFIIGGVSLTGYSIFQIWDSNQAQKEALVQAEELISTPPTEEKVEKEIIIPTFKKGETMGVLEVPKLGEKMPIIEGTDEKELAKGVGHYLGTALPTQNDQIVLSGHRDTLFRRFDELEIGDTFVVKLEYGDFTYEIVDTKIVDADDRTIIKSTAPNEELIVTTCYPFGYIGNAPHRFIFYAEMVD